MTTFEQEQIRQLKRINAQLNPGPAILQFFALVIALLTLLAALACVMNSQRSDVQAVRREARQNVLKGGRVRLFVHPQQPIYERSVSYENY
jgi:hypothetical protein